MTSEESHKRSRELYNLVAWLDESDRKEVLERALRWLNDDKERRDGTRYHDYRYQ